MGMQKHDMQKHVSFASNLQTLPGQVDVLEDIQYLYLDYDQARYVINKQDKAIKELRASVNHAHKRIDFLLESLENLNKKVNKRPWYKRLSCFKRR